jgi:Ca2+-binding RTX toxin-like protein
MAGGGGPVPVGGDALAAVAGGAIHGTHGADTIYGGAGADLIEAGRGDDHVIANQGNDTIALGGGDDVGDGGGGNDSLDGGTGRDTLSGGAGDDRLEGGAGDGQADHLYGGAGNDTYVWAPGDGNDAFLENAGLQRSGTDTVELIGVTFQELLQLQQQNRFASLNGQAFTMRLEGDVVTFHGPDGAPISLSATIAHDGGTLGFHNIERFRLV